MYYPHALGMLAHDCLAECQVPQDGLSTPTVARLEELVRGDDYTLMYKINKLYYSHFKTNSARFIYVCTHASVNI